MTDRELRDEIERLSAELRTAKEELESSASMGARLVSDLAAKLDAAKVQRTALLVRVDACRKVLAAQRKERADLEFQLAWAREQIAEQRPAPIDDPWDRR